MRDIPRDSFPDITVPLMLDPYRYISRRCRTRGSDVLFTRLMLRPAVCLVGEAGAKLFYDERYFERRGAPPGWLEKALFGKGGIQTSDGAEHKQRKRMFMSLVSPERVGELAEVAGHILKEYGQRWTNGKPVALYHEFQEIFTRAVCFWTGVPLPPSEVGERTKEITYLIDNAGSSPIGHLVSSLIRMKAQRWAGSLIEDIRAGRRSSPKEGAAFVIAKYHDASGRPLDTRVAGIELLNVLRPTAAVSVYAAQCAHALELYPECRQKLQLLGRDYETVFIQEVRRFYPFFPFVMAKVRQDFEWNGYWFRRGWTAILDLYGTDHDGRTWKDPEKFRPERFNNWVESPYNFIPQGGGDPYLTHRCPGELITLSLMREAVRFLTRGIRYRVPAQNLSISWMRLPAVPRSGFVIDEVRQRPQPLSSPDRAATVPRSHIG